MKLGDLVLIDPSSWLHQVGLVASGVPASGVVTKVAKNGKVSVRVNEVRNKRKLGAKTTKNEKRVFSFSPDSLRVTKDDKRVLDALSVIGGVMEKKP